VWGPGPACKRGGVRHQLIDLSMWMDEFTFPGDEPVRVEGPYDVVGTANPEWVYTVTSPTQAGTHVQGPHYFLEHGARIDELPLERFEGWAEVVDSARRGEDTTVDDLVAGLAGRDLAGRILILRTGHMDEVVTAGALDPDRRPGLSLEAAHWLIDAGVAMVAIDSVGVESRVTTDHDVNVALCRAGVPILEGLVNLAALPVPTVWLEAFPLKLRGVEGTPCRAVAKVVAP
jgi:arylformamidase